jgi:hypothetical protein
MKIKNELKMIIYLVVYSTAIIIAIVAQKYGTDFVALLLTGVSVVFIALFIRTAIRIEKERNRYKPLTRDDYLEQQHYDKINSDQPRWMQDRYQ